MRGNSDINAVPDVIRRIWCIFHVLQMTCRRFLHILDKKKFYEVHSCISLHPLLIFNIF